MTPLPRPTGHCPANRRVTVAVAAFAAALVVNGCTADKTAADGKESASPSERTSASSTPTAPETPEAPEGPEVGTWETEPVTREQLIQTLTEAGFAKFVDRFESLPGSLPNREAVFSLEMRDGASTLYAALDDEAPTIFDRQSYAVVGKGFELTSGVGQTVLRSRLRGDTLALGFVSSTEPDHQQIPVEAILRVYYTTAAFHRTGT